MAEYIRHNDEAMLKASERVLATYRDELLPCTSFEEFCDVAGKWKEKHYNAIIHVPTCASKKFWKCNIL